MLLKWILLLLLFLEITVIMCWINKKSTLDKCVEYLSDISHCYLIDKNACFENPPKEMSCFGLVTNVQETREGHSLGQTRSFLCQLIKQSSINLDSMNRVNETAESVFNGSYLVNLNNMGEKECFAVKNNFIVMSDTLENMKKNILCNAIHNSCIKNEESDTLHDSNVTNTNFLHDYLKVYFVNTIDDGFQNDDIHESNISDVHQFVPFCGVKNSFPDKTRNLQRKEIYHNDRISPKINFDCDFSTVINVIDENNIKEERLHKALNCNKNTNSSESTSTLEGDNDEFILNGKSVSSTYCRDIDHKFTFVSALFDLHRKDWPNFQRDFEHYLNYSTKLLHMNAPLVAFVDQSAAEFVKHHRKNMENITEIIEMSLEEFELYEDYSIIRDIMDSEDFKKDHAFLHHPEGFSPEYNILMNSKFTMLNIASKNNYFNSTHFFWIDMGYGHSSDIYPNNCDWAPNNLMYNQSLGDRITYIQLNPVRWLSNIHEIYKQKVPPFLNGGFFGGSVNAVQRYYNVHKQMFKLLLLHEMVDDDQTLAIVSWFEDSDLFNLVDGWWYDAFKLFH